MPNRDKKGPKGKGPKTGKGLGPCKDKHGNLNTDMFNEQFTKVIRGELNNVDDPRGGYSQRDGYRKQTNPGQGPFTGGTVFHGLDEIGSGKAGKKKK
jgi:hypothetical protein